MAIRHFLVAFLVCTAEGGLVGTTSSGPNVLALVYNDQYRPTELGLLTDSILRYGTFKNAKQYPLLRAHLDVSGLVQDSVTYVGKSLGALLDRPHSSKPVGKHANFGRKRSLLGSLLHIELDMGLDDDDGSSHGSASIGVGVGKGLAMDVTLSGSRTSLSDSGWQGATTTRLVNSQSDNAWFAHISFGNPVQTLVMFLDCGSADTVVYNSTCKNCQLNNHTAFDSRQSKSFKSTSVSFSTQYGDGTTLRGVLGNDYVNVTQSLRTPPTQILAVIDSRTGGSDTHRWDGIMGIGPDHLSFVEGNVTPLSNLVKNGELAQPLVGIALVKQDKLTGAPGGGEYRWGELNQNYILGDVVYTPVSSSYFWGTQMNGIFVNGEQMLSTSDYRRALFDTGTTLVYTSDAAAKRIHGEIAGAQFDDQRGFWYVPCDATGAPNVFFEIGGVRRGVPASDIAFRPSSTGNGLCMSGIQGGSDQYTLLGAVFIKNQYLVLNYGSATNYSLSVGLAARRDVGVIV